MKYDVNSILDAAHEDGYNKLKKELGGAEFDLDFCELAENNRCLWTTAKGELHFSLEVRNVMTVVVRDDNDCLGECCTYDFDEYAFVSCVLSAVRDYLKDVSETFINEEE